MTVQVFWPMLVLGSRVLLGSFVFTLILKLSSLLVVMFASDRPVMEHSSYRKVYGQISRLSSVFNGISRCSGKPGPKLDRFC